MKKLFWLIPIAILGAAILWFSFIWYAMAQAAGTIIGTNAEFWRQQLYITQGQISLDYTDINIGSNLLRPSVIVTKPVIHYATIQGSFDLATESIEFIGSFTKLGSFSVKFPEIVTLKSAGKTMELRTVSAPDISLRSTADTSTKKPDTIIIDEFKLADATPLAFMVNAKIAGNNRDVRMSYPTSRLAHRWVKVSYEIYPYLQYFSGQMQQKIGE